MKKLLDFVRKNDSITLFALFALVLMVAGTFATTYLAQTPQTLKSLAQAAPTLTPIPTIACQPTDWTCSFGSHTNCANTQTQTNFNNTWCCGKDEWGYEDSVNYGSPGACGKPSKLRSLGCQASDICQSTTPPPSTPTPLPISTPNPVAQCGNRCIYSQTTGSTTQCFIGNCKDPTKPCGLNNNCWYNPDPACDTGDKGKPISCANSTPPPIGQPNPTETLPPGAPTPTIDPIAFKYGDFCDKNALRGIVQNITSQIPIPKADQLFLRACYSVCAGLQLQVCTYPWIPSNNTDYNHARCDAPATSNCAVNLMMPPYGPFSDINFAQKASRICQAESSGDINAENVGCLKGISEEYSVGLFQINLYDTGRCPGAFSNEGSGSKTCIIGSQAKLDQCRQQFKNPPFNKQYAYNLSRGGNNWHDWLNAMALCAVK